RRAHAHLPNRGQAAGGGGSVAGGVPPRLGAELPAAGRPAGPDEGRGTGQRQKRPRTLRSRTMPQPGTLQVSTPTDTTIVITRSFSAPRHLVWDAMTRPELVRRWMFCPPG